jgi:hypothetical protein
VRLLKLRFVQAIFSKSSPRNHENGVGIENSPPGITAKSAPSFFFHDVQSSRAKIGRRRGTSRLEAVGSQTVDAFGQIQAQSENDLGRDWRLFPLRFLDRLGQRPRIVEDQAVGDKVGALHSLSLFVAVIAGNQSRPAEGVAKAVSESGEPFAFAILEKGLYKSETL